jgi:hypothetical protein
MESLDRICNTSYRPSQQDILLTRVKTTGIVEILFVIKGVNFRCVCLRLFWTHKIIWNKKLAEFKLNL